MKIIFVNETEWKKWDAENKFEMPDDGQFEFKFKVVSTNLARKENDGSIIQACIERMEKTEAFDDYDGINMDIEFRPDFDEVDVSIIVRGLLK